MPSYPCLLTRPSLLFGILGSFLLHVFFSLLPVFFLVFFSIFILNSSLFLHYSSPPRLPPLFPFSTLYPPAEKVTPRHKCPLIPSYSFPPFSPSDLVSVFRIFFSYFTLLSHSSLHRSTFHLLSTSWFRLSF